MRFIRHFNYKGTSNRFESPNTGKSETVPDKTLTIEQMLAKSLNGALEPIQYAAEYTGLQSRPQPKDYSDLYNLIDAHKSKSAYIREKQLEEAKQKNILAQQEREKQIIDDYLEKQKQEKLKQEKSPE